MSLATISETFPDKGTRRAPGSQLFAVDLASSPTVATGDDFYIYAMGITTGEMNAWIGWRDEDDSITDGALSVFFANLAAGRDLDSSSATTEIDTDSGSPNFGRIRLKLTFL